LDLDGDGDYDLLLGEGDGTIDYYLNTGDASSAEFTLQSGASNPFNGVTIGSGRATISCVDIDLDGDLDCFFGESGGTIVYYKNTGSSTAADMTLTSGASNPLNAAAADLGAETHTAPHLVDLDGDGDYDVVIGSASGYIFYYQNTGSNTAATFVHKTSTDNPFNSHNVGTYSIISCIDVDHDIDLDCFVGIADGTVKFLQNTGTFTVAEFSQIVDTFSHPMSGTDVGTYAAPHCIDIDADCSIFSSCNGHGTCGSPRKCTCFEGWGASTDNSIYKAPDCSKRTCSAGRAWIDVPTTATTAHAATECSNAGLCDRSEGQCKCFDGYTGDACQRLACPTMNALECSGHGKCVSMRHMATMTNALPLSAATTYEGAESTTTWDQDKSYGCVCDSSWGVGLGSGERQTAQYFGPDCSLRRCPTGNDPVTIEDETDCSYKVAEGNFGTGEANNICHVDCSNRGTCDYEKGRCECYNGFFGDNCVHTDARAVNTRML
jgi:hypothetical protein